MGSFQPDEFIDEESAFKYYNSINIKNALKKQMEFHRKRKRIIDKKVRKLKEIYEKESSRTLLGCTTCEKLFFPKEEFVMDKHNNWFRCPKHQIKR